MDMLNLALVVITAIYVVLTYFILRANTKSLTQLEKQVEEATRPYVLAHPIIRPGSVIFELEISNLGRSVAYDVHLSIDREFYMFGEKKEENKISNLPIFRNGIPSMTPAFEISFHLGSAIQILDEGADREISPSKFNVRVSYKNNFKRQYTEAFDVDLAAFDRSVVRSSEIVNQLEKIAGELKTLNTRESFRH